MTTMTKTLIADSYEENSRISGAKKESDKTSLIESLNATISRNIRIELTPEEYAVLAKRAMLEGGTPEAMVAQTVGKLLQ